MKLASMFSAAIVVALLAMPSAAQKINFGPDATLDSATYPEFAGYLGDDGSAYGDRGNGFSYGWLDGSLSPDGQAETRNRDNAVSPDERYDTMNHMIKGDNHTWQIDLANGDYNVWLVAGDGNHTDQTNDISVSGGDAAMLLADPDGEDNFDEYNFAYSVTNGYLRLSPDPSDNLDKNQKVAFIEISPVPEPGSIMLAAAGMITALGALRRRRR